MRDALRIIKGDLFNICERIKAIDEGYFVAYNLANKRFEVHNKNQRGSTLALVVPYAGLDCRTVDLVNKTRSERRKTLFEEMERENLLRENAAMKEKIKRAENGMEKAFSAL